VCRFAPDGVVIILTADHEGEVVDDATNTEKLDTYLRSLCQRPTWAAS
jgi:hypothetical protein